MTRVETYSPTLDVLEALLWQYNDAMRLQRLLELKQTWYDEQWKAFWTNWRTDVFDLRTANDFGLSVWAIILDLPLSFEPPASDVNKIAWGFGPQRKNFTNGNFKRRSGTTISLTTEQKRIALRMRYFQLFTAGNVVEVNKFLLALFGPEYGRVYVRDNLNMTVTYVFNFTPPSSLRQVIDQFDLLPRPAAVGFSYTVDLLLPFGFENHNTFDNSNFYDGGLA